MRLDRFSEARADGGFFVAMRLAVASLPPGSARREDQGGPWLLTFQWTVGEVQARALAGAFCARAFAKGIGAGYSGLIGEGRTAAAPGRRDYELGVLVPAGSLPEGGSADDPDPLGMYLITGVVHHVGGGSPMSRGIGSVTIPVFVANRRPAASVRLAPRRCGERSSVAVSPAVAGCVATH